MKIGLALGSGSARGWAHVGVIEALADRGIRPDVVAGTSIGALVGGAYASGNLQRLHDWLLTLTRVDVISLMDVSWFGGGLIQGEKLFDFFRQYMSDGQIESLPVPFGAVATELQSGREVWLREGLLSDAVRASIALPGLFTPARLDDTWYIDGGLVNPVPVSLCRAMGADVVIAVNLNGDILGKHLREDAPGNGGRRGNGLLPDALLENELWQKYTGRLRELLGSERLPDWLDFRREGPGMFEVMATAINIMQDRITRSRMAGDPPELLIAPRLAHIQLMEFERASEAIEEGRRAVARMDDAISLLKERMA
ncbi:MAG: patatin-like phospholipase RssA [Gammaproteobacteria bacterium]|nr:MAG: patatin-like phospholipase RssA [Gammaproteobacteria bacterium]